MTTATATAPRATVTPSQLIPLLKAMKPLFTKPGQINGSTLTFAGNNNTLTVTHAAEQATTIASLDATECVDGSFSVPAHSFTNGLTKLVGRITAGRGDLPLPMEATEKGVSVTFDGITTLFPVADEDSAQSNMQPIPDVSTVVGTIGSDSLKTMWQTVNKARGHDQTLLMLTGVNMEVQDTTIEFATSDRFRLATFTSPFTRGEDYVDAPKFLIPGDAMDRLVKYLPKEAVPVTIKTGNSRLSFTVGNVEMVMRLLDANFPNIERLFDMEVDSFVTFDRAEMVTKIKKMAAQVATDSIILTVGNGAVQLLIEDSDTSVSSQVDAVITPRMEDRYAFDPAYLIDILGAGDSTKVSMAVQKGSRPALFVDAGEDTRVEVGKPVLPTRDRRHLLMPRKLNS